MSMAESKPAKRVIPPRSKLWDASVDGELEIVAQLLRNGAEPNDKFGNFCSTALHMACMKNEARIARLLLKNKADPNSRDISSSTPLHYSCSSGAVQCVQLLVEFDANTKIRDGRGRTPFEVASELNCRSVIDYLATHCLVGPSIRCHPASEPMVGVGKDITLRIIAEGSAPMTYQWSMDDQKLNDDVHYEGSTTDSLLIKRSKTELDGEYHCVVRNEVAAAASTTAKLKTGNVEFSKTLSCYGIQLWLKQNDIPDRDVEVFRAEMINGEIFSILPQDVDKLGKKFCYPLTLGGKTDLVKLIKEVCEAPLSETIADLQIEFDVTDEQIDGCIAEKDLFYLAGLFGCWKSYAGLPGLGLTDGEQSTIHVNLELADNGAKMKAALKMWWCPDPQTATFRKLLSIVMDLKDKKVFGEICKYLKNPQ